MQVGKVYEKLKLNGRICTKINNNIIVNQYSLADNVAHSEELLVYFAIIK